MKSLDTTVGRNVERLRKRAGLTQGQVARYLGLDQSMVSKIESGERSIGLCALERLCDLFFCELDELVAEQPSMLAGAAPQQAMAFRAKGLDDASLAGLGEVGRIARNLNEMTLLLEKAR